MEKFPITNKGFEKLEIELKLLKSTERPNVIKAIAEARAHGDFLKMQNIMLQKKNKVS